jgi:hypothetical protein
MTGAAVLQEGSAGADLLAFSGQAIDRCETSRING